MKQAAFPHRLSIILASLLFLLSAGLTPLLALQSEAPIEKLKSIAASKHEIVMLLIKKKDYSQALNIACEIFDLKWPESQESLLLRELIGLSDAFSSHGQAAASLQLIEKNSKSFRQTSSQIAILKEQGFLYKSLKQDDKALKYFNRAQELENKK
jgi:hypothetical protein